jgi:hypothetical protein
VVAFENDFAAMIGEEADGKEGVVLEMGKEVSLFRIRGQHFESRDGAGVRGVDYATVGEGDPDALAGGHGYDIGARRGRKKEVACGTGVEDGRWRRLDGDYGGKRGRLRETGVGSTNRKMF